MLSEYHEKISKRLWRYGKALIYFLHRPRKDTLPVFIMGCGRSGTTMLINIFHRDHRAEALDENDPRIARDYMLVFDRIPAAIIASKAPVLIMKPILNSFDALYLLKTYDNSKVIWVLRDYKDMIASSIKKFGTVVSDWMKDLILHGKGDNWLSRGVPIKTREMIYGMGTLELTPYDWMALVWWSVNRSVILDRLSDCDRFLLVQYEAIVRNPEAMLKSVYEFVGLQYHKKTTRYIHAASIGKGVAIGLHPYVESLCQDLANALIR
jgi:hypothetical protein